MNDFNWKFVDEMIGYSNVKYWKCKKFNLTIRLYRYKNGYGFDLENKKTDFYFNSEWTSHSNENIKKQLNEIKPIIKEIENQQTAKKFIEEFVIKIKKEEIKFDL